MKVRVRNGCLLLLKNTTALSALPLRIAVYACCLSQLLGSETSVVNLTRRG